ncbi:DUF3558 family protein [Prauserella alba]|uniref:DUF3558 family protein n=1 Tax=Prauserella alba TaxID=176898 RepID=UPI0020A3D5BD|nr:DUF3558 family protein [Prauserella alba]MCP2179250.1 Protein of unknown function (DUF3558) [Prauserella alba]
MSRTSAGIVVGAFVAISVGCSPGVEGQPEGSQTEKATASSLAPSSPSSADSLAGIDPCSLLKANELSKYGNFPQGSPGNVGVGKQCDFQKTREGAADSTLVVSVNVRADQGLDDAQDMGQGVERAENDGREYARIPSEGSCTIAIGVSESSRVDVYAGTTAGTQKSCEIADEVAAMVEQKLPQS